MKKSASPSSDDFRVRGEKTALFLGFVVLFLFLLFVGIISAGLLAILMVVVTGITVWIQQGQLLGGCARVSENQFPRIYAIACDAADRLNMPLPDVFVIQDPTLNAFAIGFLRARKSVVLHSATVEAMEQDELEQIIGHEFSHIKCGHTNLMVLTNSSQCIKVPIISSILSFIFLFWNRKAEYTCDRGGLLASRNPKAAIAAMCKLAVGPKLFQQMDIDDFLRQRMVVDQNTIAKLSETCMTHPYLVKRIHAIQRFFQSDRYKTLAAEQGVAEAGKAVGESAVETYGTTKEGLQKASDYAVENVQKVGDSVKDMSTQGARKATEALVNGAGWIALGVVEAGKAVGESTHEAYCTTTEGAKKVAASAIKMTQRGLSGARKSAKKVGSIFSRKSS